MSSDRTALRHNAFVYDSDDEYVSRAVRFLREWVRRTTGQATV